MTSKLGMDWEVVRMLFRVPFPDERYHWRSVAVSELWAESGMVPSMLLMMLVSVRSMALLKGGNSRRVFQNGRAR